MSPLHIQLAIHYLTLNTPYAEHEPEHANSPAVREFTQQLIDAGLLTENYKATKGLSVYVDALCKVPLPIQRWIMST
jgi:hypothetical protein